LNYGVHPFDKIKTIVAKNNKLKIENSAEAWESGELGIDLKHAIVVDKKMSDRIDEALGLQMIYIRLDKELIESYKLLSTKYKVGGQSLMREALKRFIQSQTDLKSN
jgi:hypothetical protein